MLNRFCDLLDRRARLADRPLAVKVAAAPGVMIVLVLMLAGLSMTALLLVGQSVERIVHHDMRDVTRLNDISGRFQAAESQLYRLLVAKASAPDTDVPTQADAIKSQLRTVRSEIVRFGATADPRYRTILNGALIDVDRYAAAVEVVTSMLEVDFASSAAMIAPFRDNALGLERKITRIADDGVARANAGAANTVSSTYLFQLILAVAALIATLAGSLTAYAIGRSTVKSITEIAAATAAVMEDVQVDLGALRPVTSWAELSLR